MIKVRMGANLFEDFSSNILFYFTKNDYLCVRKFSNKNHYE